jgi:2-polyprenyl-3-methyl-5-hydroxy-6-metoxy-1,4-benzoquinol methylase
MSTTVAVTEIDPAEIEAFAGRLFDAGLAAVELVNVVLGARLGLYEALADAGPSTPTELAANSGIAERYAREWLEQQAAADIVEVDDAAADAGADDAAADADERRYSLSPARAHVLLDQDSEAHMMPLAESAVAAATWLPFLEPAYRSGAGVPYANFGVHDLQAAFTRAVAKHHVVQRWLPSLPDVHAKLTAGMTRVAEIGCGEGLAAIAIAEAFPGVEIDGFDLDDASIAVARKSAADSGVSDRVRFEVRDAITLDSSDGYDLVLCIEMLHDTNNPVGLLRGMRNLRGEGGAVLVVDERVAPRFTLPAEPIERLLYSFSTLHCLPVGMADQPTAATGTVIRPDTVRRYALDAGFTSINELPVQHPQFRLYRLEG